MKHYVKYPNIVFGCFKHHILLVFLMPLGIFAFYQYITNKSFLVKIMEVIRLVWSNGYIFVLHYDNIVYYVCGVMKICHLNFRKLKWGLKTLTKTLLAKH